MEITCRDKTITCEEGTTLFDISKQQKTVMVSVLTYVVCQCFC